MPLLYILEIIIFKCHNILTEPAVYLADPVL